MIYEILFKSDIFIYSIVIFHNSFMVICSIICCQYTRDLFCIHHDTLSIQDYHSMNIQVRL